MKDECAGAILPHFIGLRCKMNFTKVEGQTPIKKAKDVKTKVVKETIHANPKSIRKPIIEFKLTDFYFQKEKIHTWFFWKVKIGEETFENYKNKVYTLQKYEKVKLLFRKGEI